MRVHSVRFAPRACADVDALSPDVAARILKKIAELERDPSPRGDTVKRVQGSRKPLCRLRAGDWRAVFRLDGRTVVVLRVIHRSELERALRSLFG